jgi:signal transduction histidine kinase
MRIGLKAKFIVVIAVFLILVFGMISFILLRNNIDVFRENLRRETRAFATLATTPIGDAFTLYKDSGRIKITSQVEHFTDLDSSITNVSVINGDGHVEYTQKEEQKPVISPAEASSFEPVYKLDNGKMRQIIYPYFESSGVHRYSVVYDVSSASIDKNIHDISISIARFSIIALIISALLTYLLINSLFLIPLSKLSQQALAVTAGNLDQHIAVKQRHKDEIGDLTIAVDKMATSLKQDIVKLQELDKLKTEFMIIASHNLRTPLSVLAGYIELLQGIEMSDQAKKFLDIMQSNSRQLGRFAEELLTISQVETTKETVLAKEKFPLHSFLQGIIDEFKTLADNKGLTFAWQIPQIDQELEADRLNLRSAIWNILDNALKFTASGGRISLEAILRGNELVISIEDNGIGIPAAEQAKLFTKFHRGTSVMHYDYGGTGIGLYATKLIIDKHNGTVQVNSTEGKGTIVTISVPTVPPPTLAESPIAPGSD